VDRPAVRRSILFYILSLTLVQAAAARLIAWRPGPAELGWNYLFIALAWTFLAGWITMRNAHLLYTFDGAKVSRLNLATRVTLLRVLAIPLLLALIFARSFPAAGIVFLGAAFTDWLDGFLARRMKDVTQLGRIADPSIDALFCGLTLLILGIIGLLPLPVLLLAALRYGILLAGALLLRLLLGRLPVRATFFGRLSYFLQYGLLAILLIVGDHPDWLGPMTWALGSVQVLVSVQLIFLGRSLYREATDEA